MKIFFNTKVFDRLAREHNLAVTDVPPEAALLVLGAQKVNYSLFNCLKAVYRFGVGTENIDFDYLKQKGISLYLPSEEAKTILYESTANFTVYGILNILYKDALGDAVAWIKKERDYIGNKIALVIGTGHIGKRVVKKLSAFMKVITYDILTNQPEELEPLIKAADIISIHTPLNAQTKNFFDERKLSWVKDGSILINTARGGLFSEQALYEKLQKTNCRAFFDVFWEEPYKGKLKELGPEKFLMTPHVASQTYEYIEAGFEDMLSIIKEHSK